MHESWAYRLSPCPSESSSTRSSHLSVYTAVSSVSSPPPSPSTDSKTKAFFGSPFADDAATPLPPPNPQPRANSRTSSGSDATSDVSVEDTPRIPHAPPSRTLNAEFFGVALLPTPPPSIRSLSHSSAGSRDTSTSPPPHRTALPPLSRFFPSRARYGSESEHPPPSHGYGTNVRRDFVHLDTGAPSEAEAYHTGEQTESPVEDQLSQAPPALLPHPPSSHLTPTVTVHPDRGHGASRCPNVRPPTPPLSEPEQTKLEPGITLSSSSLELELVKPLGTGSFSSVWLAQDTTGQLNALELVRKSSLARSKSLRGRRSRTIDGTRPTRKHNWAKERAASDEVLSPQDQMPREKKIVGRHKGSGGRLVAVKMTERELCDSSSRSRVSFVREVEVLRHISHPSIVSYLHSFSTPTHHCLVLEHVGGGELLDLVDNPASHARLDEPLVRRIWGELCRAVAWMHSVGLVHRDVKLENILLTADPFARPLPSHSLIKLTDFGLSRFIDPAQPHLTTLCGSDSYAAPELVMGKPYDGRQADAWACGVVLYVLATRRLPFDAPTLPPPPVPVHPGPPRLEADWEVQRRNRAQRKALLNRIAVGTYSWPESDVTMADAIDGPPRVEGVALGRSEGVRRMVGRLLVRDPRKRARVADLWVDEWMHGEGAPPPPVLQAEEVLVIDAAGRASAEEAVLMPIVVNDVDGAEIEPEVDLDAEAEGDDEGVLVDGEDIGPGHVVRQEH